MHQAVVGDHVVASIGVNKRPGSAFLRASETVKYTCNNRQVVRGVVTQVYRNGAIALSIRDNSCYVNVSDIINIIPRQNIRKRHINFNSLNRRRERKSKISSNDYNNKFQQDRTDKVLKNDNTTVYKNSYNALNNGGKYLFDHHIEVRYVLRGMANRKKTKKLNFTQSLNQFNINLNPSSPNIGMDSNADGVAAPSADFNDRKIQSKLFLKAFKEKGVFTVRRNKFLRPKSAPPKMLRKKKGKCSRRPLLKSKSNSHHYAGNDAHEFKTKRRLALHRLGLLTKVFSNSTQLSRNRNNSTQYAYDKVKIENKKSNTVVAFNKTMVNKLSNPAESIASMLEPRKNRTTKQKSSIVGRYGNDFGIYARHNGARDRAFLIEARRNKLLG